MSKQARSANIPGLRFVTGKIRAVLDRTRFPGSKDYWESRYRQGGTSGEGSYGTLAQFKANVINSFVEKNNIQSIMEFGCGDGAQLSMAKYPMYTGLDVSESAIQLCRKRFKDDLTKSFFLYAPYCFIDRHAIFKAELVLSLDVIYHIVEDEIFERYMHHLFAAAEKYIIIYSTNKTQRKSHPPHVRHRCFSDWITKHQTNWALMETIQHESFSKTEENNSLPCDFYIYAKSDSLAQKG